MVARATAWLLLKQLSSRLAIVLPWLQVSGRNDQNQYLRPGTTPRVTPEQIEQSVEQSLKRLGTDYLDLLQVHWPDRCELPAASFYAVICVIPADGR